MPRQEPLSQEELIRLPAYCYYGVVPVDAAGNLQIYDGDTVKLVIDLGMEQWIGPVYYRLYGIQAPEIRPLVTRKAGTAARNYLRDLVTKFQVWQPPEIEFPGAGVGLIVKTHKKLRPKKDYRPRAVRGKFGRWLVELIGDDGLPVNINQRMVDGGHAKVYLP
jgi:hypothetical protein